MSLKFEWDENKNIENIRKHNISFEEAKTVFGDIFARISKDEKHSTNEQRWHIIGLSKFNRILVIAYTERNEYIRIITSRKANKREKIKYEKKDFK
jgi:uncharacterized protein